MPSDLSVMLEVARAIKEWRWVSRLSDRTVMRALAETVVLLAETPRKELTLAPTESDMAKISVASLVGRIPGWRRPPREQLI